MKNSLQWFVFIATIILRPKLESGVRYEIVWFNLFSSFLFLSQRLNVLGHLYMLVIGKHYNPASYPGEFALSE